MSEAKTVRTDSFMKEKRGVPSELGLHFDWATRALLSIFPANCGIAKKRVKALTQSVHLILSTNLEGPC